MDRTERGLKAKQRKTAFLAIDTILRGLEFDQVAFGYDESATPELEAPRPAVGQVVGPPSLTFVLN